MELYDNVKVMNFRKGWITQYYKNFGRCYTFTVPEDIRIKGVGNQQNQTFLIVFQI